MTNYKRYGSTYYQAPPDIFKKFRFKFDDSNYRMFKISNHPLIRLINVGDPVGIEYKYYISSATTAEGIKHHSDHDIEDKFEGMEKLL